MPGWEKWLWGGLGWATMGPIGGILGFALGAMRDQSKFDGSGRIKEAYPRTRPGDFGVSLLVLFAAVMRADRAARAEDGADHRSGAGKMMTAYGNRCIRGFVADQAPHCES